MGGSPEENRPHAPANDVSVANGCGLGCLGLVVLVAVLFVAGAMAGDDSEDTDGDNYGAQDVCEQFVEDRLKAPATADFSGEKATHLGGGRWRVTGDVDAENSFGAQLRMTYVCEVQFTGGGDWTLKDLAIL